MLYINGFASMSSTNLLKAFFSNFKFDLELGLLAKNQKYVLDVNGFDSTSSSN